ncbi:MAG: cbb3-type cytochrome oxidase assembly protein CcoS [Bacteroidales bacterium]
MSVIFFLIGVGVLVAGGFLGAFIWSVKSGQYDDSYSPSVRILFDNPEPSVAESTDLPVENDNSNQKNKTLKSDNNKN